MVKDYEADYPQDSIDIFRAENMVGSDIVRDVEEHLRSRVQKYAANDYVAIFDRRNLDRECLANTLNTRQIGLKIFSFSGLESWQQRRATLGTLRAALFNIGSNDIESGSLRAEIAELVTALEPVPVVVLSNNQELDNVLQIIDLGVNGFIPSSVDIDVCIQAIGLAIAGGQFVPAASVLSMRSLVGSFAVAKIGSPSSFTARQSAVAEALRRGKANKMIAHELNLCESTVKAHIRNIMKKLGATNRTEVACKVGEMFSEELRH